ncbi:XTP/dITP diphosphatase [Halostella litorea]|uniref:XTP/dITP diphosphatase n=1 Tax=Halostella litorea TaxID=2528831 RepID=UPI001091E720|nr:XTP/dITP diphosphatase [Halostella litorea]
MIRFVTGNEGKVREAREYLDEPVEQVPYDYTEIQGELEEIALYGARETFAETDGDEPVLVDDTGLFVEALDGFPGAYSSFVEDTLGIERIPDLVADEGNRRAAFRTVMVYYDGETAETFEGNVRGRIVEPRGEGGFGYDPVFEHDGETFAEMDTAAKNAISHRGRALERFADWLAER